jgi:predicted alpha/beta superfamily hydrolase
MQTRWLKWALFALVSELGACAQSDGLSDSSSELGPGAEEPGGIIPTGDTVLRVHYPLSGGRSLSVRGSLAPFNWSSGVAMTKKSDTLYELRIRDLKSPLEWKPLVGDSTWSRGSNYRAAPGQTVDVYPHFFTGSGRYVRHYRSFHSTVLGNDRGVWLYLPPSFDENPLAAYPVIYMHDGQNLFDPRYAFGGRTWRVAETLDGGIDALDAAWHLPEVVVVGPENTSGRIYEYTPTPGDDPRYMGGGGDLYLRFLRDELKPAIEGDPLLKGRLHKDGAHTALAGSSLGGLITAYAGLQQPAVWSRLGIFSPSTWWDSGYIVNAVAAAGTLTPRWARVYVDSGQPGDGYEDTVKLVEKYRAIGYRDGVDFKNVVAPGAMHNEDAWAARLPAALRFLCADW